VGDRALLRGYPRSCEFAPSNVSWTVEPNLKLVVSALALGDNPRSVIKSGLREASGFPYQQRPYLIRHELVPSRISCISLKQTACCLKSGLRTILPFHRNRTSRVEETNPCCSLRQQLIHPLCSWNTVEDGGQGPAVDAKNQPLCLLFKPHSPSLSYHLHLHQARRAPVISSSPSHRLLAATGFCICHLRLWRNPYLHLHTIAIAVRIDPLSIS
jgi:hypothetical protein